MNLLISKPASIVRILSATTVISLAVASCATAPTSPLGAADARARLTRLEADPNLGSRAPVEIREAESAVAVAEQPVGDDVALGEYRVYMADRMVEIARSKASTRYAVYEREGLERERASIRLAARTREADRAQSQADIARSEADAARKTAAEAAAAATTADLKAQELQRQIAALQAEVTDRGLVLTLGNVLFATGRADLKQGSVNSLDNLVTFLNEHPNRMVAIEGHTDNVGSSELNETLSRHRAESVKSYLMQQGIQSTRLSTTGMGETLPVASNDTESGRQQNRRVEVIVENPSPVAAAL